MKRITLPVPKKISIGPSDDRKPPKDVPRPNGKCAIERAMLGIPKRKTCHLTSPAGSAGRQVARWIQPPVPNCTICGVVLIVALPPDAVTEALLIQTPAVANSPHNTRPARPRPT